MSKALSGHTTTGGALFFQLGFIKTNPPSNIFMAKITGIEFFYGPFVQKTYSAIYPTLKVHLHDLGHVICIAEQTCVPANTSLHGSAHIMNVALNGLISEVVVFLRRYDFVPGKFVQGIKGGSLKPHGNVQKIVHQFIYGFPVSLFYKLFENIILNALAAEYTVK